MHSKPSYTLKGRRVSQPSKSVYIARPWWGHLQGAGRTRKKATVLAWESGREGERGLLFELVHEG